MKRCILLFLWITYGLVGFGQDTPPFWNDIQKFKTADKISPPPVAPILFVGSSSFTMWSDLKQAFPGKPVLNRGFGGSSLPDLIRYSYDVVLPYRPKQVVIYCGENDLAASKDVSPEEVLRRLQTFFQMIRINLPEAKISYVSMKPSPSRAVIQDRLIQANAMIKNFLENEKNTSYIDVYGDMLDENGDFCRELFLQDMLHMNSDGYAIWKRVIEPHLIK
ncbi:MAG: G-D-S-L family lipolytic protein [Bacteroidetes bacterium]|nr:G-D-S-L family lipolytic protein [Bacteroidota bacterium]